MTSRNEMCFDIKSFLTDTMMLSPTERWAYIAILMQLHLSNDGWIEDDDALLVRLTGVSVQYWPRVRRAVEPFLVRQGGKLSQKRILRDRESRSVKSSSAYIDNNLLTLRLPSKSEIPEPLGSRSQKTRTLARQFPEGWKPTLQDEQYAIERSLVVREVFEAFKDYHVAKGSRFTDWSAAWRTWVRNEIKFNHKRNGAANGKRKTVVDYFDEQIRRLDERDANLAGGQDDLLSLSDGTVRGR